MYGSQWGSLVAAYSYKKSYQVTRESISVLQVTRQSVSVLQVMQESITGTASHTCCIWMCNEIKGSYDKIIITIVPSYTGKKKSLVCCRWHCYLCSTLVTIQTATNSWYFLWWYLYITASTLQVPRILIIIGLIIAGIGCIFLGPPSFITQP